jgi:hypothetical protein
MNHLCKGKCCEGHNLPPLQRELLFEFTKYPVHRKLHQLVKDLDLEKVDHKLLIETTAEVYVKLQQDDGFPISSIGRAIFSKGDTVTLGADPRLFLEDINPRIRYVDKRIVHHVAAIHTHLHRLGMHQGRSSCDMPKRLLALTSAGCDHRPQGPVPLGTLLHSMRIQRLWVFRPRCHCQARRDCSRLHVRVCKIHPAQELPRLPRCVYTFVGTQ